MTRAVIAGFAAEFARHRAYVESAAAQLTFEQLRLTLDPEVNSIAVVMKHVAGNLRSRWTDALTADGEKPWRNRDSEFIDDFPDRAELEKWWALGWSVLDASLAEFADADLGRMLRIRHEEHTLAHALTRSLAHTAYHTGQIVQTARIIASRQGVAWKTLTVPRGGSVAYNETKMGPGWNSGRS